MSASKQVSTSELSLQELVDLRRKVSPVPLDVPRSSLLERFLVPPFSVLDARKGYWQERKRMWLAMGVKPTLGRGDNLLKFSKVASSGYGGRGKATSINTESWMNQKMEDGEVSGTPGTAQEGTSSFDPVLCELVYRWFTPIGGRVLDPFVGGPMAGIVAVHLNRSYTGVDIRPEQIDANKEQCAAICPNHTNMEWIVGSAVDVGTLCHGDYDLIYSCPPYADLEKYSDDPRDLSTMDYDEFLDTYQRAIMASCNLLREDRFACFVVGDIRDRKTGNYRNFVGDTVRAFQAAGLELYNDAVLVTAVGSLAIRAGKQFASSRKLGKAHQNVLVFLKGDAGRATKACGEVDIEGLEMPECTPGAIAICQSGGDEAYLYGNSGYSMEAYLHCDIAKGDCRLEGRLLFRMWLGTSDGWQRIEDNVELTYIAGGKPYLNKELFPGAPTPVGTALPMERIRR